MKREQEEADLEDQAYARTWIQANTYLFDPLARAGFESVGRGAVLVNIMELILRRHSEEGHPFNYHASNEAWLEADEFSEPELQAQVRQSITEYVPEQEFVLVLLKDERSSVHHVPLLKEEERDQEIRGAYVYAEKEERHNRLTCTDFWARPYRLTTPFTAEWLYRVA